MTAIRETSVLPVWLRDLAVAVTDLTSADFTRFRRPDTGARDAAVLVLLGGDHAPGDAGPGVPAHVLLVARADAVSSHAGQPAFPGGGADADDDGPVATAVRETVEETGVDPDGVTPFAVLPELYVPVSDFAVTPVLAWWQNPSPVGVVDPGEIGSVHQVPIDDLTDPDNRVLVRHPSGFESPGFLVDGLVVWGFTGGLLSRLLTVAGWDLPWDSGRMHHLQATS